MMMCHLKKILFVVLLFGSFLLIPLYGFAEIKELTAEEYRAKGYETMQAGDYVEAIKNYNKAISLGVNNPASYNDLGVLYEKIGNAQKAEEYYLEAIKVNPKYLPAYSNVALFYKTLGNNLKAVYYFKKRYELAPREDSWAKKVKEELLALDPSQEMWVRQVQAVWLEKEMAEPEVPEIPAEYQGKTGQELSQIALDFYNQKQFDKAVQVLDFAIQADPADPNLKTARAEAYSQWQKLLIPDNIRDQLNGLDEETKVLLVRKTDDHVLQAIEHYLKGQDALSAGNLEVAKTELDSSLALVPANPTVMEERKKVEFALAQNVVKQAAESANKKIQEGDYASAKSQLKQAMDSIPKKDFIDTSKAKKMLPEWNKADYQEFENRLKFNEQHFASGKKALEQEDYKKAIDEFTWALKLIPSDTKSSQQLKQAEAAKANQTVQAYSEQAVKKLESGDPDSAKKELEDLLSTLSK
ncbi:MAG: tetratricopeptide repeat protein [Candidatus Omnitrophica bacterium]|nr:tetratricopeptide repeat protein [Candidatus Omnitrophota bacterium]